MITLPWIVDNMIYGPDETTHKLRRPSEVEARVQQSLRRLNVPDWYANKCRASPRIIADRRPMETRPAPWKDEARDRPLASNDPRRNAKPNTAVVRPILGNTDDDDDDDEVSRSERDESNESSKCSGAKTGGSRISQTFPKISPSRRIRNINIVFPTSAAGAAAASKTPVPRGPEDGESDARPGAVVASDGSATRVDPLEESGPRRKLSLEKDETTSTGGGGGGGGGGGDFSRRDGVSDEGVRRLLTPRKFYKIAKITTMSASESERSAAGLSTPVAKGIDGAARPSAAPPATDDDDKLFSTPRKSTEMENIIKNNQHQHRRSKRSSGRSFVEEIIEELNAKCSPKVKSSYVSPTATNFVKKLVRALEMGCAPEVKEEEERQERQERATSGSRGSRSISNPRSGKDSDSGSDSEPKHSRSSRSSSRGSPFRSFSRALEERRGESVTPYVDDEDESVYWIPLPTCKLPRTSSLKNVTTTTPRLPSSPSPELVATRRPTAATLGSRNLEAGGSPGWGRTFDKGQPRSRQLFRIDETTVVDSGYSDRSGTNSSSSSVVGESSSWRDGSEATRAAAERSSDNDSDNGCSDSSSQQRTFDLRMLRSRQRTSVV